MRSRIIPAILGLVLLAYGLIGCEDPVGPGLKDEPGSLTVAGVLQSLPEIRVSLPKSLRGEGSAKAIAPRAVGDTVVLTSAGLESLKSQAWIDLQGGNPMQVFLNKALKKISEYAKANSVELEQVFSIPFGAADLAEI